VLFKLDHVDVSCQDLTNQSDRRNLPGWLFGGLRDTAKSDPPRFTPQSHPACQDLAAMVIGIFL
jgi:hypothetical protein